MIIDGTKTIEVRGFDNPEPATMTGDAILAELAVLAHKCATVASFGGGLARRYAWEPRMAELKAELARREVA